MYTYEMFNLQMFAGENTVNPEMGTYGLSEVNRTTDASDGNDLSVEMKTFYNTALLENARASLYYNQFGAKQPLQSRKGKTVEWRRFKTFAKATKPLEEGIIPNGNKLDVSSLSAALQQYGDYTPISDQLEWAAVDPIIAEATNEHGAQAGATLDTLTRDVVAAGTNVYRVGEVSSVDKLSADSKLTPEVVARVATILKQTNTPKINGSYIAIIHPSVAYDLRQSDGWVEAHKYASVKEIFNGEIGELHGVRFVETTEAKIKKNSANVAYYYCTFFGKDAWGTVEPTGMSLETIIKSKEQIGGPLNQFSTVGWKAMHAAKILYQERMVNVLCGSSFSATDEEN